ncbi:resolvase, N-terminal domain protein [Pseudoflavonifractor capillosus ATCC 29799]|uniref:Resolvase, N-terminal domain protein n=1 Tax=Pseudoflavonifractor capillosus ATCC 29799 TaxID=411467 RepID=A6P020_9FIRM|nr:resolvase, N-terminal domain protein [Pseudoflavonifractor capillosus ATCC 29799]
MAAYCRVSTDSEEQINSYTAQKAYYTQKIEESPDWELAGIFADEGITGTSMKKRKEFNRMITACKRGGIDLILTKSLSRFARNTVDCLETVRMLKARGIGVIFEKENINTLTESSEFLITLFSGFAQAESESLSSNIQLGIRMAMKEGKVNFHYRSMLGYQRGADGKPEIVPEEAEVVRRIYRRYLEGCSEGQIQRELTQDGIATAKGVKAWSHQIVHNILTNEKYVGDALLQKTFTTDCISKKVKKNTGELPQYYIKDNHPAIIPRDIYQRVQEEMARRTSKRKILQKSGKTEQGKYSAKYALSERLVCGECGSPYKRCTWARNGVKRIVWRCVSRLEFGKKYCHESPSVEEYKLHAAILTTLNRVVEASNGLQEELAETLRMVCVPGGDGDDLLDLEHELEVLTARQNTLLDQALANMDDLTITEQLKTLLEEKQHLQARIDAVKTEAANRISEDSRMAELTAYLEEHLSGFQQYDDGIVRQLVERITVVDAETIRIKFRYSDVEIEQAMC